ncbi:Hypothetical predicted protein [Mytilus galloprovincialis]|uniref:Uncharacterized protein n=1 Tax=Mytilus galloprovincialis TaxID=29158 RepID=A0A8B6HLP2_MYTGA|nr:Hypothetical predicted protein [Mytilus galloprovincialis]
MVYGKEAFACVAKFHIVVIDFTETGSASLWQGCNSKYSDQSTDENSDNGTTLWDEIIDDSLKNADLIDEDANATSSVQLLIDNGADLNINDTFGRSILLTAVSMENHKQLTQYYIKKMDKEQILHSDVYQSALFHYVAILQKELDICDNLERAPWDYDESEDIKQTVIKFAEELCIAIGEEDARLKCTLRRSGSSEEGTKVGDPNEFDFIFCLVEIQKLCSVKDLKMEKEFVELNANMTNEDIPQHFKMFFGEDGLCKISEVRMAFSRAVKTIVFDEQIWK